MATLKELQENLTPQQQMAAHLLVANEFSGKEKRSQEELAEEIGITRQALHQWRTQNVNFIRYQAALTDMKLDSYRSLVDSRLMALIERGPSNNGIPSIKAIELYYKLSGRLVERREVTQFTEQQEGRRRLTDEEVAQGLEELNDLLN
ncbi:phBC6A51 family helix-turn-helix protein [Neobacillus vireti]|uniref:phBC6A51 family helix-turn-helix protein n=1 Tax=Neobacillus vireti TaxID=220686 RepID=UPI002FFF7959